MKKKKIHKWTVWVKGQTKLNRGKKYVWENNKLNQINTVKTWLLQYRLPTNKHNSDQQLIKGGIFKHLSLRHAKQNTCSV